MDFHAQCDPRFLRKEGSENGFAQHLHAKLGESDYLLLVAEIDGEVVGFLNGELSAYPPCFAPPSAEHPLQQEFHLSHAAWHSGGRAVK